MNAFPGLYCVLTIFFFFHFVTPCCCCCSIVFDSVSLFNPDCSCGDINSFLFFSVQFLSHPLPSADCVNKKEEKKNCDCTNEYIGWLFFVIVVYVVVVVCYCYRSNVDGSATNTFYSGETNLIMLSKHFHEKTHAILIIPFTHAHAHVQCTCYAPTSNRIDIGINGRQNCTTLVISGSNEI